MLVLPPPPLTSGAPSALAGAAADGGEDTALDTTRPPAGKGTVVADTASAVAAEEAALTGRDKALVGDKEVLR